MARATRNASPSAVTWLTKPTDCAFVGVDAAAGEKQIAHDGVSEVALEPRNAAETGNQTETQFGKAKARHFVGDNQIARERQFESASKGDAVDRGNRGKRGGVDCIHYTMNSFQKVADAGERASAEPTSGNVRKVREDRRPRKILLCERWK